MCRRGEDRGWSRWRGVVAPWTWYQRWGGRWQIGWHGHLCGVSVWADASGLVFELGLEERVRLLGSTCVISVSAMLECQLRRRWADNNSLSPLSLQQVFASSQAVRSGIPEHWLSCPCLQPASSSALSSLVIFMVTLRSTSRLTSVLALRLLPAIGDS